MAITNTKNINDNLGNVSNPLIYYGLQPALLGCALLTWYLNQDSLWVYPAIILAVQIILGVIEYQQPARPEWLPPAREKIGLVLLVVIIFFYTAVVAAPFYEATLNPALSETRALLGITIWPFGSKRDRRIIFWGRGSYRRSCDFIGYSGIHRPFEHTPQQRSHWLAANN